jgi:hypothetical protein
MAENFKKVYQGQPGTSASSPLFTVGAATQIVVRHIRVVNNDTSDRTLKLWHDGNGDGQVILPATTIKAGSWAEFDGAISLEASDTFYGQASVNTKITVTVYGLEIT